jgi:hypothetical protein
MGERTQDREDRGMPIRPGRQKCIGNGVQDRIRMFDKGIRLGQIPEPAAFADRGEQPAGLQETQIHAGLIQGDPGFHCDFADCQAGFRDDHP